LGNQIKGKADQIYHRRGGFCLETQHYPDAPNRPQFPSTVLEPGEKYKQTTIYHFSIAS
jgi:aldose 1-epimerase